MLTEEEVAGGNLLDDMSSMKSFLTIESTENKNLQAQMDDDRITHELSMFASHPMPKESSSLSIDVAAKIKSID